MSSSGLASSSASNMKSWLIYYFCAFAISASNFGPLLVKSHSENLAPPERMIYYLIVCYILSLPLLFEFTVDMVISLITFSFNKMSEPRVGYLLVLISLFLPIVVVSGPIEGASSSHNIVTLNCFVSFLQSLVIIGQYDKLQFRTKGHWTVVGCLSVIVFYVASQVLLNLGVVYDHNEDDVPFASRPKYFQICTSISLVCGVLSFCLHYYLKKNYFYSLWVDPSSMDHWRTDDYVAMVLQFIAAVYFCMNVIVCALFMFNGKDFHHYTNVGILTHIILGLCTAILPGRVVRNNFILLKVWCNHFNSHCL